MTKEKQIEEMAKLKAINEMKAVIRDKTESCKTCSFYLNGLCDNACELEEDNQKICTDLYNAGYRKQSEGEWLEQVRVSKEGKPLLRHYKCNLCGVYLATQANFCPNCGAKMKGGAE